MKSKALLLLFFVANYCFSQSVNDYKAVIIPLKYEFLKTENQYRLQTLTKINLQKAGFQAFYNNESIPQELNDKCSLLYMDVKNGSSFLVTKLQIIFKDCYGAEIYKSEMGKSREKEYQLSYTEALNEAFKSVYDLQYKYNAKVVSNKSEPMPNIVPAKPTSEVEVPVVDSNKEIKIKETKRLDLLYAQPTPNGYQLIDNEPKVIIKLYKTSNPTSFIAIKSGVQGVLVSKENQWFFEYYKNDQLITEIINVKF